MRQNGGSARGYPPGFAWLAAPLWPNARAAVRIFMHLCPRGERPDLPPIARGVQTSDLADHSAFPERMVMHVYACVCVMIVIGGLLALGLTVLLGSRA